MFKRALPVIIVPIALILTPLTGCTNRDSSSATTAADSATSTGVRLVAPEDAAATIERAPEGLTVIDVRTAEEFAQNHIEGAINIDFYAADFAEQVDALDKNTPYVIYCQTGNRSSKTRALMTPQGFTDVEDIEGGISAWSADGLPVVRG